MRLACAVDRERLVLEGVELGTHAEPRGLGEGREDAGHPATPAKRANRVMPIIGDSRTTRSGLANPGSSRPSSAYCKRQRAAVRVADQMERRCRTGATARLADCQAGRRLPVLPVDVGEARGHRAVSRQADGDRQPAVRAVRLRDVPGAVRRVGETVQQHDGAARRPVGLEDEGAVPVVRQLRRIDRAGGGVPVELDAVAGRRGVDHRCPDRVERRILGAQVAGPVGRGEIVGVQLLGDERVPRLQPGTASRVPRPDREDGEQRDAEQGGAAPQDRDEPAPHGVASDQRIDGGGVMPIETFRPIVEVGSATKGALRRTRASPC